MLINVFIIRKKMISTFNRTNVTPPWMSPEENTWETMNDILEGVAYAANLLFGLPTNGYVLWLIIRGTKEKIASDLIPLNQIVVEILLSLSAIWFFLDHFISVSLFKNLFLLLSIMFLIMRPLVQSYICLEQYVAIVYPVLFLRCKRLRYRLTCCCVSWLIVITISVVGVVVNFRTWFLFMITSLYQFFLMLMAFCCFSVLRTLKRPGPGEERRDQHRGNRIKKRAFNLIVINLVYTTVGQLPMAIIAPLSGEIPKPLFYIIGSTNVFIFVITGFVPPILYLYRVGKLCCTSSCP